MDEAPLASTSNIVRSESSLPKKHKRPRSSVAQFHSRSPLLSSLTPSTSPPPSPIVSSTPTVVELQAQIVELKANHEKAIEGLKGEIEVKMQKHWTELMSWGQAFAVECQASIDSVAEGAAVVRDDLAEFKVTVEAERKGEAEGRRSIEQSQVERDSVLRGMAQLLREEFKLEISSLQGSVEKSKSDASDAVAGLALANNKLNMDLNRLKMENIVYRTKVLEAEKARTEQMEKRRRMERVAEETKILTSVSNLLKPALEEQGRQLKVEWGKFAHAQSERRAKEETDHTACLTPAQSQLQISQQLADIDKNIHLKVDQHFIPRLLRLENVVGNLSRNHNGGLLSTMQSVTQVRESQKKVESNLCGIVSKFQGEYGEEVRSLRTRIGKVESVIGQMPPLDGSDRGVGRIVKTEDVSR